MSRPPACFTNNGNIYIAEKSINLILRRHLAFHTRNIRKVADSVCAWCKETDDNYFTDMNEPDIAFMNRLRSRLSELLLKPLS